MIACEGIREATSRVGGVPSEGEAAGRDAEAEEIGKVEKVVEKGTRAGEAVGVGVEAEEVVSCSCRGQVRPVESTATLIRSHIIRRPLQVRLPSCSDRPLLCHPVILLHQVCQARRPRLRI
jgi:hypothetical protein